MNSSPHVQSPLMNVQRGTAGRRAIIWPLLRCLVGAIFLYAGAVKAWDPLHFVNDIEHFHILSWPLAIRLAFYLPWLEIFCGLALITGRFRAGGIAILTGLTLVFLGATISAKARGIDPSCGCFGSASNGMGFGAHLLLDLALLGVLVGLAVNETRAR